MPHTLSIGSLRRVGLDSAAPKPPHPPQLPLPTARPPAPRAVACRQRVRRQRQARRRPRLRQGLLPPR